MIIILLRLLLILVLLHGLWSRKRLHWLLVLLLLLVLGCDYRFLGSQLLLHDIGICDELLLLLGCRCLSSLWLFNCRGLCLLRSLWLLLGRSRALYPLGVLLHAVGWTFARNHSLLVQRTELAANLLFPGHVFVLHLVDELFHAAVRIKLDDGSRNTLARL